LADEDKSVIEAFGVWGPKNLWEKNTTEFTELLFVIDENGIVDEVIKVKLKLMQTRF
jgi:peroxiredoxin Q/BCP